ncbi:MAG: hypothetical protein IKD21_04870 [Clostridia bacterium]|nr:hypothetical protein [Clostridia bacterium]
MDIKLNLFAGVISEAISDAIEYIPISTDEVNNRACKVLEEIQGVIQNEKIESDFYVVEEIVCIFERYGLDAGFRHDF